jgi:hypothetical protein
VTLRAGRLRLSLTASRGYRGSIAVSVANPALSHTPALVSMTSRRYFSVGRSRRLSVTLALTASGRLALRRAVALCRPLTVRIRLSAFSAGRHVVRTLTLRLRARSGCRPLPVSGPGAPVAGVNYPGQVGTLLGVNGLGGNHQGVAATFRVGAAVGDFSPPAAGQAPSGTDPTATCDPASGTPVDPYPGTRQWAFMEPYRDGKGTGHYNGPFDVTNLVGFPPPTPDPNNPPYQGDPYLDCNQNGRWEGNLIGGGGGDPRFYTKVADPVTARAIVVSNGQKTMAVEVVDQEGLFNIYQDAIRAKVASDGFKLDGVFISATHDESAPDSLGLGGVNPTTSGVNDYWLYNWFIPKSAQAIEQAYRSMREATIRYAEPLEPPDVRQCWSSYPYTDDQHMPVLQAVGTDGKTIATLVDVSQHTETTGFNNGSAVDPGTGMTLAQENLWLSADWPYFTRTALEQHYGGVAIEMAGSVGSVESPQVYPSFAVSRRAQAHVDASQPAGCNTLFSVPGQTPSNLNGTGKVPLGYQSETAVYGNQIAAQVIQAIDSGGYRNSATNDLWGERSNICLSDDNLFFAAAAGAGVFAHRPAYNSDCSVQIPPAPNGSTTGQGLQSQVAAFRIGDGQFISIPGEAFPFTFLRGLQGPEDMPDASQPITPWLIPHMTTPFRFIDGLAEDMIGYIFPPGNATAIPTQSHPEYLANTPNDRFNCHHSDDGEAASANSGMVVGNALVPLLDKHAATHDPVAQGRYVLSDGSLSRDPTGYAGSALPTANAGVQLKCDGTGGDTVFHADPAVGVELKGGTFVQPLAWMSLSGLPQAAPDRDTRGYFDQNGNRVWLDVFPDVSL